MSKRVKKTKKKSANKNGRPLSCRLRVLRGRAHPHGPNGTRIRLEMEFGERDSLGLAARILQLTR